MKPEPARGRAVVFNLLWVVAVAGNLSASVLNYVVWSKGLVWSELYATLLDSGWGTYAVAGMGLVLAGIVTPLTWLTSLDRRRRGRPVVRLYLLWFSLAALLAAYVLGSAQVGTDNFLTLVGAAVVVLVFPFLPLWIERVLGRGKIRAAERMLQSGHPAAALSVVRVGLLLQPGNATGERVFGLALTRRGRGEQALPYLEEVYALGDRSPELVAALADSCEASGDVQRACSLVEELQQEKPSTETFARLIRLRCATGQHEIAVAELWRLSPEERQQWSQTLEDLLAERRDVTGLARLAAELADREERPFRKSRAALERAAALEPHRTDILEQMAALAEKAGERGAALALLEKVGEIENPPAPELLRRMAGLYLLQGQAAQALRCRRELVSRGEATLEEKLAVLDDVYSRGEYEKAIELVAGDEQLQDNPRAAAIWALSLAEAGRSAEAMDQIVRARSLGPPPELAGELSSLEAAVRSRRLTDELAELGARAKAHPDDLDLFFEYLDRLAASRAGDRVVVSLEDLHTRRPDVEPRIIEALEEMLEKHGPSGRLISYLADLHLRRHEFDEVFRLANTLARTSVHAASVLHDWSAKILLHNPDYLPALLEEARYLKANGEGQSALGFLERYTSAGGERTPETAQLEMEAAEGGGDLDRADAAGEDLLAFRPEDQQLRMHLADIAVRRKDFGKALERMRAVLEVEPERPGLQLLIRQTEKQASEARVEQLREQISRNLDSPALREELGDLVHDLGRLNEAIVEYQRASHQDPSRHIARAKLAYVLARKGLYSDAEEALTRTELRPDQPADEQASLKALFYSVADIMADDNEETRALALLKRVFHVDAGYRDVLPRIEQLQRLVAKKRK